jgi:hypothetical protein
MSQGWADHRLNQPSAGSLHKAKPPKDSTLSDPRPCTSISAPLQHDLGSVAAIDRTCERELGVGVGGAVEVGGGEAVRLDGHHRQEAHRQLVRVLVHGVDVPASHVMGGEG